MAEKLYDVFISYSSKDQKLVEAMCHYLEERNLRCFVSYRDVPKGKDWGPFIEKGIEDSKVLVYVHTEASNMSEETTREINLAFEEGCVVIPFRVSAIKYGTGKRYRLNNLNWLDAFPQSPENYFGDLFDILKVNFPQRIQQKEDQKARLEAEKAEAERIKREKEEAERRERERRQREEEARRRREEAERRKEERKEWWQRNQSKVWGILAAVAFIWIMIIAVDSCEGTTETATETAVDTPAIEQNVIPVVETPAIEIQEETWINEEEEQRQAEIERQNAKERKIKEEQERKRQEEERKRQSEEKKRQDEINYKENKRNGNFFFSKFLENPDNRLYKDQAIQNYERALEYKEDAEIRDRYNKLIKEK